jgi:hypothetical protein
MLLELSHIPELSNKCINMTASILLRKFDKERRNWLWEVEGGGIITEKQHLDGKHDNCNHTHGMFSGQARKRCH